MKENQISYSIKDIVNILGIASSTARKKLEFFKEKPVKKIGKQLFYRVQVLELLKPKQFIKYYPLKTTETFYIYESKLNTQ